MAFGCDAAPANLDRLVLSGPGTMNEAATHPVVRRGCSDVFRLWMSVAVGAPWSAAFMLALLILGLVAVQTDSDGEFRIEISQACS